MIDTHAHINFDVYNDDRKTMLKECSQRGLKAIIIPGTTLQTSISALNLAHQFSNIYAGVGIHPTDIQQYDRNVIEDMELLLNDDSCVALGEIGLDFYRDTSFKKEQLEMLALFFDLAKRKKKPLIIHNRCAEKEMTMFLKQGVFGEKIGVFHCFQGSIAFAKQILDYGFYISFTGIITFKNAQELREIVRYVSLERILLETDSPYLTPHPYRGKRNAPFYLPLIAQKIAEVKKISLKEVVDTTTKNAKDLFSLFFDLETEDIKPLHKLRKRERS